ncbi:hypothetical protein B9Z52_03210 [Limnohabitans sp. Jir72]|nr:hypothetical protein B9Z52_03210 [Limnohabitans sp. Jir72]
MTWLHSKSERQCSTSQRTQEISVITEATTFTVDELGFIQIALNKVLVAVANGELDLNDLARKELANRGLDKQGQWVGFDKANQIYNA